MRSLYYDLMFPCRPEEKEKYDLEKVGPREILEEQQCFGIVPSKSKMSPAWLGEKGFLISDHSATLTPFSSLAL